MVNIIGHRKLWLIIAGSLVVASIVAVSLWGLKFGIDFTGGSLLELSFENRPATSDLASDLANFGAENVSIQPVGDQGMLLRFKSVDEAKHQEILKHLEEKFGKVQEQRFESVGPTIGKELRTKAIYSVAIVLICIIIYIAWAFRKVSKPVASWKYGVIAVLALLHDVGIPIGLFAVLGHFAGVEANSAFVAAILTILGYSVNDTIVVFDRTRENLIHAGGDYENFDKIVNESVNQTFARSINTTFTTLLALVAVFFWGGESVKYFALALIVGIGLGAYSSIFIASPALVVWEELAVRKRR
ncbi:protein translocase subunit SecF [Candidatus Falkowbacteria bacterium]|nr:protein translocase subunit SecF [Candidatus Falkowbacteria bacterium]